MKILFVLNNYYATGNGLSASARRTVQALKDAGEDVRVLSGPNPSGSGPQPEFLLKKFYFPFFQGLIEAHGYQFASSDKRIIEEAVRWADVIHLEEPFVLEYKTIKIAKRLGKPIVGTYHLHPENIFCSLGMGDKKEINRWLLRRERDYVFDHCSHLQCPTQNVQERLERHHFKSELRIISNGLVPEACIRPVDPPADYLDPLRPLKVVYIGRLSVEKDQPTLLEAIRHSSFSHRIQLHFAGQGPMEKEYKRMAKKLYEDRVVRYKPEFSFHTRDELRTIAAEADLCIHCATVEVEGLSIMEAIQQGAVPIIAAGWHTGTSQFALDARSVFPEGDAQMLAGRMDWWLAHPKERWEMGKKYAASMAKYDIAKSAAALIKMYQDAINKNKQ